MALRSSVPGVATGLAWTPVGGDILFIEATRVAGQRQADPDRPAGRRDEGERAGGADAGQVARAAACGIRPASFEGMDLHMHVPAGAIPKDGPSAGVAMFIALASLFTDRPVRHDVAMTGEISLRGLVLPVGGIKEKVLAAQRAGLRRCCCRRATSRTCATCRTAPAPAMEFVSLETVDDAIRARWPSRRHGRA